MLQNNTTATITDKPTFYVESLGRNCFKNTISETEEFHPTKGKIESECFNVLCSSHDLYVCYSHIFLYFMFLTLYRQNNKHTIFKLILNILEVIKMSLSMLFKLLFLWCHSFWHSRTCMVLYIIFAMIYVYTYACTVSLAKHENNDGNENAVEGEMHGFLVLFIHWLFPFIFIPASCLYMCSISPNES